MPKAQQRRLHNRSEDERMLRHYIPRGVIVLWHGLIVAIPEGWIICDGSNGTPDLREKFVKGAAAATEAGTTGGSATHTHGVGTYSASGAPSRTVVSGLGLFLAGDDVHTHTISGTSASGSSEPAYYTIQYIMKL